MSIKNLTKPCTVCHWDLPLIGCFYIFFRRGKWHFDSQCKECRKAATSAWYQKNKAKAKLVALHYRLTHKNLTRERNREYRVARGTELRKSKAEYYQSTKAQQVARNRAYRAQDPETHNGYSRAWRKRNPETRRASAKNNKIKRRRAVGYCSPAQWIAKCEYWGWRCYLCLIPLTSTTLHMEHRKPLSRGGSHWPANLAPACEKCNLSKNNKTENEFRQLMKLPRLFA